MLRRALVLMTLSLVCLALLVSCDPESEDASAPILGTGEYSNYTITRWGELGVVDKSLVPAELVIPETVNGIEVTGLSDSCFEGCTTLESVVIPDSVTSISVRAFKDCSNLVSVELGKETERIYDYAFFGCTKLESITLPETIIYIEGDAFSDCTALTSITIPKGVEELKEWTFYNCTSLESVVLSEGVIKVGGFCFVGCQALKSLTLPTSLSEVGSNAFSRTEIEAVYIPDIYSWCSIRFKDNESGTVPCSGYRTTIYVKNPDNPDEYVSIRDIDNWELDLSASDKVPLCIPVGTFRYCRLSSIKIPATVKSIGKLAFNGSELKTIYITGGDDVCELMNTDAIPGDIEKIYVPESLVDDYKGDDDGWSSFAEKIEKLPEEV